MEYTAGNRIKPSENIQLGKRELSNFLLSIQPFKPPFLGFLTWTNSLFSKVLPQLYLIIWDIYYICRFWALMLMLMRMVWLSGRLCGFNTIASHLRLHKETPCMHIAHTHHACTHTKFSSQAGQREVWAKYLSFFKIDGECMKKYDKRNTASEHISCLLYRNSTQEYFLHLLSPSWLS